MATYHIDLVNGDDANDGSTWALAKKNLFTPVSNDVFKIAKTPDPVNTGVNATWVNDSAEVITASPLTKSIEQAIGNTWTLSANVTGSAYTTRRKLGASCQNLNIATAFLTGKVAYKTLSASLDLSSFTHLNAYINTNNITNANNSMFRLCLCSDATGDVVVNSFAFDNFSLANVMQAMVFNNGSSLGNNINSVAIYGDVNASALNLRINNIFASTDILNLHTLFGKSNNAVIADWFSPQSIVDDTIIIDCGSRDILIMGYDGTTETVELKIRKTHATINALLDLGSLNISNVEFSFGWDINSDTKNGMSWFDMCNHNGILISFSSSKNNYLLSNVGVMRASGLFATVNTAYTALSSGDNIHAVNCYIQHAGGLFCSDVNQSSLTTFSSLTNFYISNCYRATSVGSVLRLGSDHSDNINIKNILNHVGYCLQITSAFGEHNNITMSNIAGTSLEIPYTQFASPCQNNIIRNLLFTSTTSDSMSSEVFRIWGIFNTFINLDSTVNITNSRVYSPTYFRNSIDAFAGIGSTRYGLHQYNSALDTNPFLCSNGYVYSTFKSDIKREESSNGSWLHSTITSGIKPLINSNRPSNIVIAEVFVIANIAKNISVWVSFINTTSSAFFIIRKDINEIADNVIIEIPSGSTDWQLVNIPFTPLETGVTVIELSLNANSSIYLDSITE